jgi:5-methylcytosine-specific restriction endonuclease McrA
MTESLFASCIYTIRHQNFLDQDFASGGRGEFVEHGRWVKGSRLLQDAGQNQQRLPLLFAPADAEIIDGVIYWALIDDIKMTEHNTTVRFSSLQPLPKKHRLSTLRKLSNGQPISDNYIRPYVPCQTPTYVKSAASHIFPAITVPDIEAEEITAREGVVSTRLHLHRERDKAIMVAKRKQVLSLTGRLACSACGFDFLEFYGDLGENFCEVHHLRSLADADGEVQTRLEDLAVVCSNCHRMLHRSHPFLTIGQLKSKIEPLRGE